MNPEQREAIYENAQYLRQVRPIDPEEIDEYVPGRPHPAVVREVLRELAPDLGLLERAEGTFVPVSEDALDPSSSSPGAESLEAFPEPHSRRLEDRLVAHYGPGWPEGESGDRLRERIRELKAAYFAGESVRYDAETVLAYAIYHLPDYYAATTYLLAELATEGLLPTHLRVLDVGAGVGGPALALLDFLPDDALCEYHAIEPSPAADLLEYLLADAGRNRYPEIHRERAETFDPTDGSTGTDASTETGDGAYDLLVFANVLSELDDPVSVVERYLEGLAPDGTVLLLAPADRETATGLREVERALSSGGDTTTDATIYAPTIELWPSERPTDRCWSFDVKPDLETPGFQHRLDSGAEGPEHTPGKFLNVDVQYAYSILRTDGRRKIDFEPDECHVAKLADSDAHVSERIDAAAIKLSHSLSEAGEGSEKGDGANPLFLIGDGSQTVDHYAVLTRETALNRDLRDAEYGTLLRFENVLVLWNDDEEAYNLVIDDETVVDRLSR
jgi:SAM-dependent methyltransferase